MKPSDKPPAGTPTFEAARLRPPRSPGRAEEARRLLYRPIVNASSGRLVGLEGMLEARWDEPAPPSELDRWAIMQGIEERHLFEDRGVDVPIWVQIHLGNVEDPGFNVWLSELGDEAHGLVISIVRSSEIVDAGRAAALARTCRELGMSVAADNFGYGYSTSMLLERLHPDFVKIDPQFIGGGVLRQHQARSIVHLLIRLAHDAHMRVVADGVESVATWEWLRLGRCDDIQGTVVGDPMAHVDVLAWYGAWRQRLQAAERSGESLSRKLLEWGTPTVPRPKTKHHAPPGGAAARRGRIVRKPAGERPDWSED